MQRSTFQLVRAWLSQLWLLGLCSTSLLGCTLNDEVSPGRQHGDNAPFPESAFPGETGVPKQVLLATPAGNTLLAYQEIQGQAVFQGDILLPVDGSEPLGTLVSPGTGRAAAWSYWPDNTVYYEIADELPDQQRVHDAIAHWEAHTELRFVQANRKATHYVRFVPGAGCSSYVGRMEPPWQPQDITLAGGCTTGNTIHEIGHAVGLWHEQSRSDRDEHAVVLWQNIEDGMAFAFQTYVEFGLDGFDHGAYDFDSIMHYGSYFFSANGEPTITKMDGSILSGYRDDLSDGDIAIALQMYPPPPPPPTRPPTTRPPPTPR